MALAQNGILRRESRHGSCKARGRALEMTALVPRDGEHCAEWGKRTRHQSRYGRGPSLVVSHVTLRPGSFLH